MKRHYLHKALGYVAISCSKIHWRLALPGLLLLVYCFLFITSCQTVIQDGATPKITATNPYDTIKRPKTGKINYIVDSNSIMGVHQLVLSKKCAVPGCHDGSFEPDYRTVQSAYATLVYAPCIKNNAQKTYTYRVVPFDTSKSWMYYRLVTTDKVLGRMPLYDTLAQWQVKLIAKWIMSGARDIFGNSPNLPGPMPTTFGLVAFLPDASNYRIDTIRGGNIVYPFLIPKNTNTDIWFGLYDQNITPNKFTVNQVKFSTDAVNFSNPITENLTVENSPSMFPGFDKNLYPFYDHVRINTSLFKPGDLVFMRVYVKDPSNTSTTEIPEATANFYLQTYFSFYVGM